MFKTVPALYRDCLRTIRHMAADSSKARTIRAVVRQQFDANKGVREREQIDELKAKFAQLQRIHPPPHPLCATPLHLTAVCLPYYLCALQRYQRAGQLSVDALH